jgi:hypothetical protein
MSKSTKVFAALMLAMAMVCFAGCFGSGQAKTTEEEQEATVTGSHEYVDLGLPSGTLWATCNVGAYEPEEPGYFLVWKDTEKLQKKYGWEKGWRTPTDTEWVELYKNTKCSWTTQNGETGMLCKASNGKSIFLPGEYADLGKYWSSSPYPQDSKCAISFWFYVQEDSNGVEKLYYEMNYENRKAERTVRPVRSK